MIASGGLKSRVLTIYRNYTHILKVIKATPDNFRIQSGSRYREANKMPAQSQIHGQNYEMHFPVVFQPDANFQYCPRRFISIEFPVRWKTRKHRPLL